MNVLLLVSPKAIEYIKNRDSKEGGYNLNGCKLFTVQEFNASIGASFNEAGVKTVDIDSVNDYSFDLIIYSKDLVNVDHLQILANAKLSKSLLLEIPVDRPQDHVDCYYTKFSDFHLIDNNFLLVPTDKVKESFTALKFEKLELPIEDEAFMEDVKKFIELSITPNEMYYLGVEINSKQLGTQSIHLQRASLKSYQMMKSLAESNNGTAYLYELKSEYTKAQSIARARFVDPITLTKMQLKDDSNGGGGSGKGVSSDFFKYD